MTAVGEFAFLCFFFYLPLANLQPALRLPLGQQQILFAVGLGGAGLVWVVCFGQWLGRIVRRIQECLQVLLQRGPFQGATHTTDGMPMDQAGARWDQSATRLIVLHKVCVYAGTSLLLALFGLDAFQIALTDVLFRVVLWSGVGLLLLSVTVTIYAGYAQALQVPEPAQHSSGDSAAVPRNPTAATETVQCLATWYLALVMVVAGLTAAGIVRLLGWW
jgi:hypothetical protein